MIFENSTLLERKSARLLASSALWPRISARREFRRRVKVPTIWGLSGTFWPRFETFIAFGGIVGGLACIPLATVAKWLWIMPTAFYALPLLYLLVVPLSVYWRRRTFISQRSSVPGDSEKFINAVQLEGPNISRQLILATRTALADAFCVDASLLRAGDTRKNLRRLSLPSSTPLAIEILLPVTHQIGEVQPSLQCVLKMATHWGNYHPKTVIGLIQVTNDVINKFIAGSGDSKLNSPMPPPGT